MFLVNTNRTNYTNLRVATPSLAVRGVCIAFPSIWLPPSASDLKVRRFAVYASVVMRLSVQIRVNLWEYIMCVACILLGILSPTDGH